MDTEEKKAVAFSAALRDLKDGASGSFPSYASGGLVKPDDFAQQYLTQPHASGGTLPRKRVAEVYIMSSDYNKVRNYIMGWDPNSITYVASPHDLRGVRAPGVIVFYADYWNNRYFHEIRDMAIQAGLKFVVEIDPREL